MQCKYNSSISHVNTIPWILRLYNKRYCKDIRDDATYVNICPPYYFVLGRSVKLHLEGERKKVCESLDYSRL